MWDKILDLKCWYHMKNAVKDNETGEVIVEDDFAIKSFFEYLKERIKDYKVLVVLVTQWKTYDDTKQANLAIHHVGWEHASRFIILMDYLSDRFIKGEFVKI